MTLWCEKAFMISYFGSAFPGRGQVLSTGGLAWTASLSRHLPSPPSPRHLKRHMVPGWCRGKGEGAQQRVTGASRVPLAWGPRAFIPSLPPVPALVPRLRTPPSQRLALTLPSQPSMPPLLAGLPRTESLLSCPPKTSQGVAFFQGRSHRALFATGMRSSSAQATQPYISLIRFKVRKSHLDLWLATEGPAKVLAFRIPSVWTREGKKSLACLVKGILVISKKPRSITDLLVWGSRWEEGNERESTGLFT